VFLVNFSLEIRGGRDNGGLFHAPTIHNYRATVRNAHDIAVARRYKGGLMRLIITASGTESKPDAV